MSKFSFTYTSIANLEVRHENGFLAKNHIHIYPNKQTSDLINKHNLFIKRTPKGLIVLYKKYEHFEAVTVDEPLIIDGLEVIDKKIIAYKSKNPKKYSNWLPDPADMILTFYARADQAFKEKTAWDNLKFHDFIKYDKATLDGNSFEDTSISETVKPDALFVLALQDVKVVAEEETEFKFNTKLI